ncbi:MAG: deoxynucleoside kinase [Flavobacteriales bacterium]|nr:deoxynucleoside kinase [Flavobacteriales bacterium]
MKTRIEIVGLLGSGKTTLLNKILLQSRDSVQCVHEELSPLNEVWNLIRETNQNYYLLQSAYYLESLNKIQKAIDNKLIVSDFSLRVHHYVYSFHLLQKNLINQVEWVELSKMLDIYIANLPLVTGIILIDATPTELLDNLHKRNRNLDSNTSLDYLNNLVECFQTNQSKILDQVPNITFSTSELRVFNYTTEQKLKTFINDLKKGNT